MLIRPAMLDTCTFYPGQACNRALFLLFVCFGIAHSSSVVTFLIGAIQEVKVSVMDYEYPEDITSDELFGVGTNLSQEEVPRNVFDCENFVKSFNSNNISFRKEDKQLHLEKEKSDWCYKDDNKVQGFGQSSDFVKSPTQWFFHGSSTTENSPDSATNSQCTDISSSDNTSLSKFTEETDSFFTKSSKNNNFVLEKFFNLGLIKENQYVAVKEMLSTCGGSTYSEMYLFCFVCIGHHILKYIINEQMNSVPIVIPRKKFDSENSQQQLKKIKKFIHAQCYQDPQKNLEKEGTILLHKWKEKQDQRHWLDKYLFLKFSQMDSVFNKTQNIEQNHPILQEIECHIYNSSYPELFQLLLFSRRCNAFSNQGRFDESSKYIKQVFCLMDSLEISFSIADALYRILLCKLDEFENAPSPYKRSEALAIANLILSVIHDDHINPMVYIRITHVLLGVGKYSKMFDNNKYFPSLKSINQAEYILNSKLVHLSGNRKIMHKEIITAKLKYEKYRELENQEFLEEAKQHLNTAINICEQGEYVDNLKQLTVFKQNIKLKLDKE